MGLQLIYGKAGRGKTTFCYNKILEQLNKKQVYIITPEQFSFTAEKTLVDKVPNGASINAEVLTFKRMAYRVMQELGGIKRKKLTESGKQMLIYSILNDNKKELKYLGNSKRNIDTIENSFTEFKKHKITKEMLEQAKENTKSNILKTKLEDILKIYDKYENTIEEKNLIDENDILTILSNKLDQTELFNNSLIFIDEFVGFTNQEYEIISKLLRKADTVYITICTDNLDRFTDKENDIFYTNKQTAFKLIDLANMSNIPVLEPIELNENKRFKTEELEFLEKNIYSKRFEKYDKEPNNIKLFLAKNPYSEIENIAINISKLVMDNNYRYKDIGIITQDLDTYSNLVKVIFKKYNIPIFIDEKKSLNDNILIKYIISILDIFKKNWGYPEVINYIKSGFLNNISEYEIQSFENYCIKWGINHSKWYEGEWNFKDYDNASEEEKAKIQRYKEIREEIVGPLVKLKNNLKGTKTAESISKEIYNFLIENNIDKIFEEKIEKLIEDNNIEKAIQYKMTWNSLINILEEIVTIFGDKKISFEEYTEILKQGMETSEPAIIPQTSDCITIGDIDRSRTHKVKAIFILGVNDGIFPKVNRNEGFFNDEDRKELKENEKIELAKGTTDQLYENEFNIYKALTTAEEKLFLSYISSDMEGKSSRPSILITKIKKMFPNIYEESDVLEHKSEIITYDSTFGELINKLLEYRETGNIEEKWQQTYKLYKNNNEYKNKLDSSTKALEYKNIPQNLTKENVDRLYGNTLRTSVSKLEEYRTCPFKYYLEYGLKIKEKDEFKIKNIDTGSFMHDIVDEFFKRVQDNNINIKEIEENEIEKIIEEIIEEKLSLPKNYIFTTTQKYILLNHRLKRLLKRAIIYIVDSLKYSDYEIYGTEVNFDEKSTDIKPIKLELNNGKKVEIIGKIDRIDLAKTENGNFFRIIDYKSSIKDLKLEKVYAGLQLQLITYVDATKNSKKDFNPTAALYFNLIEPILKQEEIKDDILDSIRKKYKMKGLIVANIEYAKMMDRTVTNGQDSKIVPFSLTNNGDFNKQRSKVITEDNFKIIQEYTLKAIEEITTEILNGKIEIKPYYERKGKTKTPCMYCSYSSICAFKPGVDGNDYNYLETIKSNEESIEKMKSKI